MSNIANACRNDSSGPVVIQGHTTTRRRVVLARKPRRLRGMVKTSCLSPLEDMFQISIHQDITLLGTAEQEPKEDPTNRNFTREHTFEQQTTHDRTAQKPTPQHGDPSMRILFIHKNMVRGVPVITREFLSAGTPPAQPLTCPVVRKTLVLLKESNTNRKGTGMKGPMILDATQDLVFPMKLLHTRSLDLQQVIATRRTNGTMTLAPAVAGEPPRDTGTSLNLKIHQI